jgi:site-specific DNA recombinase
LIVYNYSRFFRNLADYVHYRRLFKNEGVELVSATQEIPDGHNGQLMENMIAAFDDQASAVNSAAVKDMMAANAEAGFWNGARVPYGYETVTACIMNKKEKKKLVMNENEAVIVRMIYDWYLNGNGKSGPMGIKAIASRLNDLGYNVKSGRPFYTSAVELILTSETYIGTAYYNRRDSRAGKPRPRVDWIAIPTPAIIDRTTYDAVQRVLISRSPKVTAPRIVNGSKLLSGLATCNCCTIVSGRRTGMMLRTGKSGQYRYLVCASKATKSVLSCNAPTLRMETIDNLVLTQLETRVFNPDRLRKLLTAMMDRSDEGRQKLDAEIERAELAKRKAEQSLRNLYHVIANAPDIHKADDSILKEQCQALNLQISELTTALISMRQRQQLSSADITEEKLQAFSTAIRKRLRDADPAFRRQWVHLFVDEVIVTSDKITVRGSKDVLFSAARNGDQFNMPLVPVFARKWRAQKDSNL